MSVVGQPITVSGSTAVSLTVDVPATQATGDYQGRFRFGVQDGGTNANMDFCVRVLADTTAPETSIDTKPSDPSNNASPSFGFSGTDNVTSAANLTFECKLDAGTYASCTSPKSLSSLSDGSHTFSVRAKDAAGNVDQSPDSYTWTVDTTAPNTTIDSNPNALTNSTSASFTFSSNETGSTFQCKLDSGSYANCTSPENLTGLSEGSHTFSVRATDAAGNTDATPASYTWTVDTVAPTVSVDGFTEGQKFIVGATLPTVSCSASDSNGVQNASPTPVKTADTRNANGVGTVTYTCTATDNAGNTTSVSKSFLVIYGFSGFLQPINDTAHMLSTNPDVSTFKAASTVPVKFQLTNASGAPIQALSAQWVTPSKGAATAQAVDETVYTDQPTTGALYRWDSTAQQYIYNWGTAKNQSGFYWRLGVKLDDNQTYYVNISLR